jgi:chaperone BCS1
VTDIDKFINSEDEYLDKGIPYKRNYLLEGLPGTGKTSLIFAIASYLDMDLCVLNFSGNLDDINFMDAVSNMNDKSILVLEDIDCIFGDRKNETNTRSGISFGGILNVLDGIGRKHKLITFMTTNYVDRLDDALIRAGRIDYKLKFDYSNKEQAKHMYSKLINGGNDDDCKKFIDKIKKCKYTPATLQKYLFKHRDKDIETILDDIEEFFTIIIITTIY